VFSVQSSEFKGLPAFGVVQRFKGSEVQGSKVQGFKGSEVQGSKVQGFKGSKVQGFKGSEVQRLTVS
jgi:hypothetical protein